MPELLFTDLTYKIIGAALEVHKVLGPGFLEAVYDAALAFELEKLGLQFERQKVLEVYYKGMNIGQYKADFIVEGKVIVELKAQKSLTTVDEAQLINYPKATGIQVGLLFNFGAKSLEHTRRILESKSA
ncbi:MAG: GxxExxY protein [Anaerolineales bacterium]